VVPPADHWYKGCGFNTPWRYGITLNLWIILWIFLVKTSYLQKFNVKITCESLFVPEGFDLWTFACLFLRDSIYEPLVMTTLLPPADIVWHNFCVQWEWTWVTYISNVLSNKTILFDMFDFWCQLVVIRFVKTLSKRRMFVSSMKISACWLLHRLTKFNKICWEKRPTKTRPNLGTSFCRRDLKNTQPHLNTRNKTMMKKT